MNPHRSVFDLSGWRCVTVLLILSLAMPQPSQAATPRILEIYREFLKAGHDAEYRAMEEDAWKTCERLHFPHHYLAIEALSGEKETWFLNAFDSQEDLQRVAELYNKNTDLIAALNQIQERKKDLIQGHDEHFANYRADLTRGEPWQMGRGRFLVITVSQAQPGDDTSSNVPSFDATVFQAPDSTRFSLRATQTREQADALAKTVPGARVFAVRSYWGLPDP